MIWDNCKTYNIQGSEIYSFAEHMEKVTKKVINKCKEDLGISKGGKTKTGKKKDDSKKGDDKGS